MEPAEEKTKIGLHVVIVCFIFAALLYLFLGWRDNSALETVAAILAIAMAAAIWKLLRLQKDDGSGEGGDSGEEEIGDPVCPVCMAPVAENAYFCDKCQAPISSHATLDPLKQVYSTGWAYRKALRGRVSGVVLIGMWLIFLPGLFFPIVSVCGAIGETRNAMAIVSVLIQLGMIVIIAVILCRITYRYIQQKRALPGFCMECGYNLTGLPEPRCPECGTEIPPDEEDVDDEESGDIADNDAGPVV